MIKRMALVLGFILVNSQAFAETQHCIGVNNQSEQSIIYSQFPDDIGDFVIASKKQFIFGDEISHSPSYSVDLRDANTYKSLASINVKPGSMIVYMGEKHDPHYIVIYPGCESFLAKK